MSAPHPPEVRRRAIELARVGEQPIAAVAAKQLAISEWYFDWSAFALAAPNRLRLRLTDITEVEYWYNIERRHSSPGMH